MNVTLNAPEVQVKMKAKDMPLGSIGVVDDVGTRLIYVIRTHDNGDKYIVIWPNASPIGIEARKSDWIDTWDVTLQPKGSSITFTF